MIRKYLLSLTAAGVMFSTTARAEPAAAPFPLPAVLAQNEVGGVTVQKAGTKNYVVESLVFVALAGAALFVICKSSRRV